MTMDVELSSIRISHGSHYPPAMQRAPKLPTKGGLLEWCSVYAGEPWGRHPKSVCPALASYGNALSDVIAGVSDKWATHILTPLVPKLVGTRSIYSVEITRSTMAVDFAVRYVVPVALNQIGFSTVAEKFQSLRTLIDAETMLATRDVFRFAFDAIESLGQWDVAPKHVSYTLSSARDAAEAILAAFTGHAAQKAALATSHAAITVAARSPLRDCVTLWERSAACLDRMCNVR